MEARVHTAVQERSLESLYARGRFFMLGSMQQERLMPSTVGSKTASDPVGTSSVSSLQKRSCYIGKLCVGINLGRRALSKNYKLFKGQRQEIFCFRFFS